MREIGSVADDLDFGAIIEDVFMHIAPFRDAYFGEALATRESQSSNWKSPVCVTPEAQCR